jgi:hypothetical protein
LPLAGRTARPLALPAWLQLLLLGGLSVGVAWLGLVRPYNVFALRMAPLRSIPKLTAGQPLAQAGLVLTVAASAVLYYLAWRACRAAGRDPAARRPAAWTLIGSLLALNLTLIWLYPIGAADVFDNISRGRITAVHGGNPFYQTPHDFPRDRFRFYVAWPHSTSAYGPLWELMAAGASRLAGDDKLANVLVFKALGLGFYAGAAGLIALVLRRRAPERALQGVCLFAWNPVVIYETAGNGHNDIVVAFFVVLAVWALQRRNVTLAVLGLTGGALVKFVPALLLPVALAYGLRRQASWGARLRLLAFSLGAGAALGVLALAPFWRGGDLLALERRTTLFTTSLPAVAQVHLAPVLGLEPSQRAVVGLAAGLAVVAALVQTWRVWRKPHWLGPVRASAFVLLFYLLFACLWFQPWYTVWPLALAAILPEGAVGRTVVLLSYSAAWKTIIFDFFLYRGGPLPPQIWRETWLGPATLGVVWGYVAYRIARRAWRERGTPAPQPAAQNLARGQP